MVFSNNLLLESKFRPQQNLHFLSDWNPFIPCEFPDSKRAYAIVSGKLICLLTLLAMLARKTVSCGMQIQLSPPYIIADGYHYWRITEFAR